MVPQKTILKMDKIDFIQHLCWCRPAHQHDSPAILRSDMLPCAPSCIHLYSFPISFSLCPSSLCCLLTPSCLPLYSFAPSSSTITITTSSLPLPPNGHHSHQPPSTLDWPNPQFAMRLSRFSLGSIFNHETLDLWGCYEIFQGLCIGQLYMGLWNNPCYHDIHI